MAASEHGGMALAAEKRYRCGRGHETVSINPLTLGFRVGTEMIQSDPLCAQCIVDDLNRTYRTVEVPASGSAEGQAVAQRASAILAYQGKSGRGRVRVMLETGSGISYYDGDSVAFSPAPTKDLTREYLEKYDPEYLAEWERLAQGRNY